MLNQVPLNISNISKKFKSKNILENLNLSLEIGEIFGLIGLNGVGKTTLIKIILSLIKSDNGVTEFFGISNQDKNSRNNIAYLPEKFYPSQFLKGHEFLSLSLSYYGKEYKVKEANLIAERLDLNPNALDQKINKYSKGMGQKLGLISIFLSNAPLLILDEPMSGLDPKARIELKKLLNDYVDNRKTIFFTSHILSDIDEICKRIAVLDNNKINYIGNPEEFCIKNQENNLEKAFLKSINLN